MPPKTRTPSTSSKTLRFGLLACSSVARRRFLPAIKGSQSATLEFVASRDPKKAEAFAREAGCKKTGSYEKLLRDPEIDAVYVSTPPALHEEWVLKALDAGKHVYCEKPAFTTFKSAAAAVALARKKGVRLMEGYMFVYHPQTRMFKELISAGKIGAPKLFSSEYIYPKPGEGNFRLDAGLGGGVFLDGSGYGPASAINVFEDEPRSVFCHLEKDGQVDCLVSETLLFRAGVAHCVTGFGLQYRSRYTVTGTKGRLTLDRCYAIAPDVPGRIELETDEGVHEIRVPAADQFRLMIDDFAAGKTDFEEQLLLRHRVLDAARRSIAERRLVDL
jgi:dTDP-3,4-didehydro-2,6-dideoxy-alpha-D-glucose 3-reductase